MTTKKIIKRLREIQGMIEGDNFTWENLNAFIKELEETVKIPQ